MKNMNGRRGRLAGAVAASLAATLIAVACGGDTSAEPEPRIVPVTENDIVGKVSIADQEITFVKLNRGDTQGDADGEPALVMLETGTVSGGNRLDQLQKVTGPLTMLEIFQAFAPEGTRPHAALVTSHADELKALGRGRDASLKLKAGDGARILAETCGAPYANLCTEFSTTLPSGGCEAAMYPTVPGRSWTEKQSSNASSTSTTYLCAGSPKVTGNGTPNHASCEEFAVSKHPMVGLCIESGNVVSKARVAPILFERIGNSAPIGYDFLFTETVGNGWVRVTAKQASSQLVTGRSLAIRSRSVFPTDLLIQRRSGVSVAP